MHIDWYPLSTFPMYWPKEGYNYYMYICMYSPTCLVSTSKAISIFTVCLLYNCQKVNFQCVSTLSSTLNVHRWCWLYWDTCAKLEMSCQECCWHGNSTLTHLLWWLLSERCKVGCCTHATSKFTLTRIVLHGHIVKLLSRKLLTSTCWVIFTWEHSVEYSLSVHDSQMSQ